MNNSLWTDFISKVSKCNRCLNYEPHLIERNAYPLFMKEPPQKTDLLFIAEAPNYTDIFQHGKGYLTVDPLTDPSGRFFYRMLTEIMQITEKEYCVTNIVLCLPRKNNGDYSVSTKQIEFCLPHLKNLIQTFNPKIVCTVGGVALNAIRKIEDHGFKSLRDAAGKEIKWYGRILFPLYHTSLRARFGPTGRSDELQEQDYRNLKSLYDELSQLVHE